MAEPKILPIEFLRECFSYDPETGAVTWAQRPARHFADDSQWRGWNLKFAGTSPKPDQQGRVRFRLLVDGASLSVFAHRIAFSLTHGFFPAEVDHRDVATGNNRVENLRPATRQQNNANRLGFSKTGLPKGVTKRGRRFTASATLNRKSVYLGAFPDAETAHAAYCTFAASHHGAFFNAGGR